MADRRGPVNITSGFAYDTAIRAQWDGLHQSMRSLGVPCVETFSLESSFRYGVRHWSIIAHPPGDTPFPLPGFDSLTNSDMTHALLVANGIIGMTVLGVHARMSAIERKPVR